MRWSVVSGIPRSVINQRAAASRSRVASSVRATSGSPPVRAPAPPVERCPIEDARTAAGPRRSAGRPPRPVPLGTRLDLDRTTVHGVGEMVGAAVRQQLRMGVFMQALFPSPAAPTVANARPAPRCRLWPPGIGRPAPPPVGVRVGQGGSACRTYAFQQYWCPPPRSHSRPGRARTPGPPGSWVVPGHEDAHRRRPKSAAIKPAWQLAGIRQRHLGQRFWRAPCPPAPDDPPTPRYRPASLASTASGRGGDAMVSTLVAESPCFGAERRESAASRNPAPLMGIGRRGRSPRQRLRATTSRAVLNGEYGAPLLADQCSISLAPKPASRRSCWWAWDLPLRGGGARRRRSGIRSASRWRAG